MPDPNTCMTMEDPGSPEYNDCLNYTGKYSYALGGKVKNPITKKKNFLYKGSNKPTAKDFSAGGRYSSGGMLVGPSHDDGGIQAIVDGTEPIEVEGGEFVINKQTVDAVGEDFLHKLNSTETTHHTGGYGSGELPSPSQFKDGGKVNRGNTMARGGRTNDSRRKCKVTGAQCGGPSECCSFNCRQGVCWDKKQQHPHQTRRKGGRTTTGCQQNGEHCSGVDLCCSGLQCVSHGMGGQWCEPFGPEPQPQHTLKRGGTRPKPTRQMRHGGSSRWECSSSSDCRGNMTCNGGKCNTPRPLHRGNSSRNYGAGGKLKRSGTLMAQGGKMAAGGQTMNVRRQRGGRGGIHTSPQKHCRLLSSATSCKNTRGCTWNVDHCF